MLVEHGYSNKTDNSAVRVKNGGFTNVRHTVLVGRIQRSSTGENNRPFALRGHVTSFL